MFKRDKRLTPSSSINSSIYCINSRISEYTRGVGACCRQRKMRGRARLALPGLASLSRLIPDKDQLFLPPLRSAGSNQNKLLPGRGIESGG